MSVIPYGRQNITDEDIAAVVEALKSDYLTQGPRIKDFEVAFAQYVGAQYAVAVANGTAALHLGALALGVKEGEKVITTPITFSASANCISYCGGEIAFVDIDPDTYLLDIDKVRGLLEASDKESFAGIIPVDLAGRAVNLEAFRALADEFDLWIMEDACHAPGGHFIDSDKKAQRCGNGKFADLSIFSFHPVKHIASGEGGMITTNDKDLYERIIELRTHGITRETNKFLNPLDLAVGGQFKGETEWPGWYMEMQFLGYNYRLTDIQAALGTSQLNRAEQGLNTRKRIAKRYFEELKGVPQVISQSGVVEGHAYHLYVIEIEDRLGLYNHLRNSGIYAQVHYIPVHLMPYYINKGWGPGDFPNAETYYSRCLSLPMFPTLTEDQQGLVISAVKSYYNSAR